MSDLFDAALQIVNDFFFVVLEISNKNVLIFSKTENFLSTSFEGALLTAYKNILLEENLRFFYEHLKTIDAAPTFVNKFIYILDN